MKHTLLAYNKHGIDPKIYYLRLSNQNLVDLERYLGKNPLTLIQDNSYPLLEDMAMILYFAMSDMYNISLGDAYDIIDDITLMSAVDIIIKLFFDMGIYSKDEPKEDTVPTRANNYKPVVPESLEKQITDMYNSFVEGGLDVTSFWDKTLGEVTAEIKSHRARCKERAQFDYVQSSLIAANIGQMFSTKKSNDDKLSIENVYPGLYTQKDRDEAKSKRSIDNLMKWANAFNTYQEQKNQEGMGK